MKYILLPATMALGGTAAYKAGKQGNPYYKGPKSDHFDGTRFFVPGRKQDKGFFEFLRWQVSGGRAAWPQDFPSPHAGEKPPQKVEGLRITLIGHASVLVQVADLNILIDPVFSSRASPFSFVGPKRVNLPGVMFEDLPPIDVVLLTHNHYDHLDLATLMRLHEAHKPRMIAPLGNDAILTAYDERLEAETYDWGDKVRLSGEVRVHLTPCYHWSARWTNDRRMALWCAYLFETPSGNVFHIGDTGYGDGTLFKDIKTRFGPPRVAILPIGAYEPRWFMKDQHINPQEAVRIMMEMEAEQALGHHWGTFQLTNEAITQPVEDLAKALEAQGLMPERFVAMRPGQAWQA